MKNTALRPGRPAGNNTALRTSSPAITQRVQSRASRSGSQPSAARGPVVRFAPRPMAGRGAGAIGQTGGGAGGIPGQADGNTGTNGRGCRVRTGGDARSEPAGTPGRNWRGCRDGTGGDAGTEQAP